MPAMIAMRPARVILLVFGVLAAACFLTYTNKNHDATTIISQAIIGTEGNIYNNGHLKNETALFIDEPQQQNILHQQQQFQLQSTRRRLASPKPEMNETTLQKQMRSYLGGLYPPVDKDMVPLYLKEVEDTTDVMLLDLQHTSGQSVARKKDLVFFWHIPKASGSTMKNIMNYCFDLKRAEQTEKQASMTYARNNILNMDTSSPDGLSFSFANQIVNSNMVDVIVSNYFLSASALFTDQHKGKTFTILRHPVDIALSLFHYRRKATWERSYRKEWMKLTFHDYVTNENYMDNWMTRQLTGTMPWVELNESHLERAKLIMKRKIFVGVVSEMGETVRQLKAHYGWEEKEKSCANGYLNDKTNANNHPGLQGGRGGKTWNVLAEKEKWDFSLYHFGLELFAKQRERYPPPAKE